MFNFVKEIKNCCLFAFLKSGKNLIKFSKNSFRFWRYWDWFWVPSNTFSGREKICLHFWIKNLNFHPQSTCHLALDSCRDDRTCLSDLKSVIHDCDIDRCDKPSCMESLKTFYRNNSHEDLSLDAALCLCRKTSSRHDSCMLAKEKLHPVCAQRPPDSSSTVATEGGFSPLPACHTIADLCKEDPECR